MNKFVWLCAIALWPIALRTPALEAEQVIHNGNTEIVFEPANATDLPMDRYTAFDKFEQEHLEVIRALSRNPKLAADPGYLKKHPELASFFDQHPDIKTDFITNPGNYVDFRGSS